MNCFIGTADFHARDEVHVLTEFEAKSGSEVHIYCMATFTDCSNIGNKTPDIYVDKKTVSDEPGDKEIEVAFAKNKGAFNINVHPNPNAGLISLDIEAEELINCNAEISDMLGNILYNQKINTYTTNFDLSSFVRGIYFLKVYNDKNVKTTKIIYN
jgi:hypothetical protein